MNRCFSPILAAFAVTVAFQNARADQLEYTAYVFSDNQENQVATTSFNLAKTLWQKTMLLLDIEMDQLTIPPLDGVTGASRPPRNSAESFKKNRGQVIVGLEQGIGDNSSLVGSYYHSREVDYLSHSVVGSIKQELFQKNLTILVRGQYTFDKVGELLSSGQVFNRTKETQQANFTITQLLSPVLVLRFGGDAMYQFGFLSDPYRKVERVAGTTTQLLSENHPGERWRQAAWAELSRYLKTVDASVVVNYRYYWDDWGVKSHTAQIKTNKYITKNWIFSPEYRYYIQNDADFGGYPGDFFTGDYKLKSFDSQNIGAGLTWYLRGVAANTPTLDFLEGASIAVLYFRYWNSLDFNANVFEGRVKFEF